MVLFRKNRFLKLTGKAHRRHRQSAAIGLKLKDILMKPWSSYHMAGKIVASASLYISLICRFWTKIYFEWQCISDRDVK